MMMRLALRPSEGLTVTIFVLLGVLLRTLDHTTLIRGARNMESFSKGCSCPHGPIHLLDGSRGLKVFSAAEWLLERHGAKAPEHKPLKLNCTYPELERWD